MLLNKTQHALTKVFASYCSIHSVRGERGRESWAIGRDYTLLYFMYERSLELGVCKRKPTPFTFTWPCMTLRNGSKCCFACNRIGSGDQFLQIWIEVVLMEMTL